MGVITLNVRGFTLVELLAVIILLGIMGGIVSARLSSPSMFELQSSRDQLVAAFRSAQQLAMAQSDLVRFSTQGDELIIYQDVNGDGNFVSSEIVSLDGVRYPRALDANQTITSANFDFDRLGRTSAATLTLTQGAASVDVAVSVMGFME